MITWDLDAVRRMHESADGTFFSSRTNYRRIAKGVYQGPGGVYLVASENPPFRPATIRRHYVERFDPETYRITKVGELDGYASAKHAHRVAKRLAKRVD